MRTDYEVSNHGSIVLFRAVTPEAIEDAAEKFADAMTFGNAYAVEGRYAGVIIEDLAERGFMVAIN